MAGPLVGLGDAGAAAGPGGQVAGHGEGFRRQRPEGQLGAPVVKEAPLGPVDPSGVGGEGGLQGGGDGLLGSAQFRQGRGPAGNELQVVDGGVQDHKGSPGEDYGRSKDA